MPSKAGTGNLDYSVLKTDSGLRKRQNSAGKSLYTYINATS